MKILTILGEAGTPVITNHQIDMRQIDRRELTDTLRSMGAGNALDQILEDRTKLLFRGLKGVTAPIMKQDTLASTRKSQNTSNYVTLLTEMLDSWKRSGVLPRSKIVSCTTDYDKAESYGEVYVVLPGDNSSCAYTGAHDFWAAFDGLNHAFGMESHGIHGAIPAVNEAFEKYATFPVTSVSGMQKLCAQLESDLESGKVHEEDLNAEMKALFKSDPETYDILEILNNLLDPSHMRQSHNGALLEGGDFFGWGEEVAVGGDIVYVDYHLFMTTYGLD